MFSRMPRRVFALTAGFQKMAVVLHSNSQKACIEIEGKERIEPWPGGHRLNAETTWVERIARVAAVNSRLRKPAQ